jgi:hypothetical protein
VKWRGSISGCVTFALLVAATALCGLRLSWAAQCSPNTLTIFDSDPSHIWNWTYRCLFVRQDVEGKEYGEDTLDPYLWPSTRYLLDGESHRRALSGLDKLLNSHAKRRVQDPVKRAILQRDLWAVFDWAAAGDDRYKNLWDQPPAMAPMIMNGSAPETTASGSGASGSSSDQSSAQAKKRKNGRRSCVT